MGFLGGGAAWGAGGGGGGGRDWDCEAVELTRLWFEVAIAAATAAGWGTGRDSRVDCWPLPGSCWGAGRGLGLAAACESLDGPPPGPPGRRSLPLLMGLPATCFGRGVGLETEFAGSPGAVRMVPLLYTSSRGTAGSLTTLTCANLPGFLLKSILSSEVSMMYIF